MNGQQRGVIIRRIAKIRGLLFRIEVELNASRDNNALHFLLKFRKGADDTIKKILDYHTKK